MCCCSHDDDNTTHTWSRCCRPCSTVVHPNQAATDTIQLRLEAALTKVTREPRTSLKLVSAGRTDAGVHAMAQVVNVLTRRWDLSLPLLHKAVNAQLPASIRVLAVNDVPPQFHARCVDVLCHQSLSVCAQL